MALLNKAEFARQCGKSKAAIGQAVKSGKLKTNKSGLIDSESPESQTYQNKAPAISGISFLEQAISQAQPETLKQALEVAW